MTLKDALEAFKDTTNTANGRYGRSDQRGYILSGAKPPHAPNDPGRVYSTRARGLRGAKTPKKVLRQVEETENKAYQAPYQTVQAVAKEMAELKEVVAAQSHQIAALAHQNVELKEQNQELFARVADLEDTATAKKKQRKMGFSKKAAATLPHGTHRMTLRRSRKN